MRSFFILSKTSANIYTLTHAIPGINYILHYTTDIIGAFPIRQTIQTIVNYSKSQIINVFL